MQSHVASEHLSKMKDRGLLKAEKKADLNILEVRAYGSFGRVYLGGEERDIMAGYQAAVDAIESISGREVEVKKSE